MKAARKFLTGIALATLAASAPTVQSATTYSQVLGYYTISAPGGTSAWTAGLVTKRLFQGNAGVTDSGATSTLSVANSDLTSLGTLSNHFVEILNAGSWTGLTANVTGVSSTGASSSSLTVDLALVDITGLATVSFRLREHVTIESLFSDGAGFVKVQDSVTLFYQDGSTRDFLYGDPTFSGQPDIWFDAGTFAAPVGNLTRIIPGQGFLLTLQSPLSIVVGKAGVTYVKDTPTFVPVTANSVNLVGLVNPLVSIDQATDPQKFTLNEAGFLTGLRAFDDAVSVYSVDGSLTETGSYILDPFDPSGPRLTDFSGSSSVDDGETTVNTGNAMIIGVTSNGLIPLNSLVPSQN